MSISELSDEELNNFEANYRRLNKTEGGKYTLSEILLEQKRRRPSDFKPREIATKITELAAASPDGFLTYKDLWTAFSPATPWQGHKTLTPVSAWLDRVIYYCVTNGLPILTVLVVRTDNRKLSDSAVAAIYAECKDLGLDVGLEPMTFVQNEIMRSRNILPRELPESE